MEYKDAISLFFERSGAMQTFWNFHITVILALIAFFASVPPNRQLALLKNFITGAFIAFAIVNLGALINVTDQRIRIVQVSDALATSATDKAAAQRIRPSLKPPEIWQVCVVHILADAMTIAAIWMLVAKKQREATTTAHPTVP